MRHIGVAYGADIDRAMSVIKEAADAVAADEMFSSVFLDRG